MSFTPGPWEEAATQICKSVQDRISETARVAAEVMYSEIMQSTQDYLRENVNFNLQSQIDAADRQCKSLRAEAASLVEERDKLRSALTDALRSTRKDFKAGPDGDRQHREAYAEQFAALSKAEGHIGQELAPDPERKGGER